MKGCTKSCNENSYKAFKLSETTPPTRRHRQLLFLLEVPATAFSIYAVGTPVRLQVGALSTAVYVVFVWRKEDRLGIEPSTVVRQKTLYWVERYIYATWALHSTGLYIYTTTHDQETQSIEHSPHKHGQQPCHARAWFTLKICDDLMLILSFIHIMYTCTHACTQYKIILCIAMPQHRCSLD